MGYGTLNDEQMDVLVKYIKNEIVHDLGAGSFSLSHVMCAHGARRVIAIDKHCPVISPPYSPCIEPVCVSFHQYKAPIHTAFMSWPYNISDQGLINLVDRSHTVIYLGKNTDNNACGSPMLFWTLLKRNLAEYVPDRKNVLAVYTFPLDDLRKPAGEELAGLQLRPEPYSYQEAERLAALNVEAS